VPHRISLIRKSPSGRSRLGAATRARKM
jgi:hypothetical protein